MKIDNLFRTCTLLAMLCTSTFSIAGNIYKWTDENGTTHYGQNAPIGVKAELISKSATRGVLPVTTPPATAAPTTDASKTSTSTDKTAPADTKKDAKTVVEKDPSTCTMAQENMKQLQKPIVRIEGKVMTIEDKNKKIAEMEEIAAVHCP